MNVRTKTVILSILPVLLFLTLTSSTCAQSAELTVYPDHLSVEEGGVACFAVFLRGTYEGAVNISITSFPFNVGSWIAPGTIRSGEAAAVSMPIPLNMSGDHAIRIRGVGRDVVMNATAYLHISPARNTVMVTIEPRILTVGQPSTLRVLIMPAHLPANLTVLEAPRGRTILSTVVSGGVYQMPITPVNTTCLIVFVKIPGFGDHISVVEIRDAAPVAVISMTTVTTTLISKTTATATVQRADQSETVLLVILGTSCLAILAVILRSRRRGTKTGRLTTPAQMELRKQASLTKCVNCKRDISTLVCPYCGVRAKTANHSPNLSHCTMCGKEIFTRFCPYCGTRQ